LSLTNEVEGFHRVGTVKGEDKAGSRRRQGSGDAIAGCRGLSFANRIFSFLWSVPDEAFFFFKGEEGMSAASVAGLKPFEKFKLDLGGIGRIG
jgi:hypothetical protein